MKNGEKKRDKNIKIIIFFLHVNKNPLEANRHQNCMKFRKCPNEVERINIRYFEGQRNRKIYLKITGS